MSDELMAPEYKEAFLISFNDFYKGNQDAVSLSMMLLEVSHVWDDLIDKDEVSADSIDVAMRRLMYDIPVNPIYRMIPAMPEHLLNVYLRWRDATAMEAEDKPDLEKTYMLRAGIYDIFVLIAHHMFGEEWSRKVGPQIRKLYGETLESLKREFDNA